MTTNNFKPILFSTEMVQAILAGRKTQTRRVIKIKSTPFSENFTEAEWKNHLNSAGAKLLYGGFKKGDILWVRETWQCADFEEGCNDEKEETEYKICYSYKASNDLRPCGISVEDHHGNWVNTTQERFDYLSEKVEAEEVEGRDVHYPSIYMPKEAARIFLKVTNVRVERLQDITEDDAIAEGIEKFLTKYGDYLFRHYLKNKFGPSAKHSFQTLWQSINAKKHPWESNPWVWVYTFERIEKPENFLS